MRHVIKLHLGLALVAAMQVHAIAQSGSRISVPSGGGGSSAASSLGSNGGSVGGGGLGGLVPNINGGFSLPVSQQTRPLTVADLQRQRFQQQVLARARVAQIARLRAEYARRQQLEQIARRGQLELQRERKMVEIKSRKEAELLERIDARNARALVRLRSKNSTRNSTDPIIAIDFNRNIRWPEELENVSFMKHVRVIDKLVYEGADQTELTLALKSLRTAIGDNARQLGSRRYIAAKHFIEQLMKESGRRSPVSIAGRM